MSKLRRKHHEFNCFLQQEAKSAERCLNRRGQGFNYQFQLSEKDKYHGTKYRGIHRYFYNQNWSKD